MINIITDQPTSSLCSVTNTTRVSGEGKLTESVTLDVYKNGFGSYTSFTHDRADSYQTYTEEYKKGSDTETQPTIAPLFTGYRSSLVSQKFTYSPSKRLALNAGFDYNHKITDRPETRDDVTGGTDYEMRYKGLRWSVGGIYKFDRRNSLQADVTIDRFRYGKEYDVATKTFDVGDYVESKKQRSIERQVKAILGLTPRGTTIVGTDWQLHKLQATSGNIDQEDYTLAYYAQHEEPFLGHFTATVGARYDYHKDFGNHFTPKVALMGSFGHVNVRATYSAGFRAPGLDELYYHYFSVNRGKAQIIFGNRDLKPEKSHYVSLGAEYRSQQLAVSLTGYINRIRDMVVRRDIDVDEASLAMLQGEFPEMTADQASKLERYSLYQNSDDGDVKGIQLNVSARIVDGLWLSANYACTYARTKATVSANYRHEWGGYALGVNLSGRLQSKTYYTAYENAPGYGLWSLNTTHTISSLRHVLLEPSLGVDNIFNKTDSRIDSSQRKYALYSPGRMLTLGLIVKIK